jgi:hypothetical protein
MLVEAMEEISRPEIRALPVDASVLAAVSAQLARPASPHPYCGSQYSLRTRFWTAWPAYSPAICSRGRLPRSIPRNLASSCVM